MKKKETSTIANGDGSKEDDDRISSLPDEILHEILERLRSHKQSGKVSLLSKRWNHLWLSYPILEFDGYDYTNCSPSRSTMNSFIAAATRKLSSSGLNYIKSVRIVSRDSAFIGDILDLIRNREPEEIDMNLRSSDSVIPTLLLNSSRLRTLKLFFCKLLEDQYKMISLRMIHLSLISIDNRALNSMIAGAPLLEKLTLQFVSFINRIEVCNHANLKHLRISISWMTVDESQIVVGALRSLETLSLSSLTNPDLEIICSSVLPSLKSLEIKHCRIVVQKIISKSPSLLSLHLANVSLENEFKIENRTLEKLELVWSNWHPERVLLHIDAPSLVNVRFGGDIKLLHAITHATNSILQAAAQKKCRFELSLNSNLIANQNFKELKELLSKVTRQFQIIELELELHSISSESEGSIEDDSPTPVVERVEVKHRRKMEQTFIYNMLWSCHPKYISVCRDAYVKESHHRQLSSLKLINQVFMERASPNCRTVACKCWRHQLKDVKIVNTNDKEEEELMDVSDDVLSTLQSENRVLFRLTWH